MDTLLKKAREGDAGAFTALMQAQEQNLWRAARAILKNDADAADALQDTALRAWQRMGEVREDTSFKAWITRILVNRCCDILRGKKRLVSLEALPEQGQEEDRDLSLDVRSVLAALAIISWSVFLYRPQKARNLVLQLLPWCFLFIRMAVPLTQLPRP